MKVKDILDHAIGMEVDGEKFYRQLSRVLKHDEISVQFKRAADEEIGHKKMFEKIAEEIGSEELEKEIGDEYQEQLRAYADDLLFTKDRFNEIMLEVKDGLSAVLIAMRMEIYAILYYQEVMRYFPEDKRGVIEKIVEEERSHFSKLNKRKEQFAGKPA